MSARVLVAGVGNIFFGDDGFGCEVARRLLREPLPSGVAAEDYGIRGTHLAYEMLAGYERVVIVDAVKRGGAPGTVYVIEPDLAASAGVPDAHGMDLSNVFGMLRVLGGAVPDVRLVGCEPASIDEAMGLTPAVARAVDEAVRRVRELVADSSAAPVTSI